MRKLLYVTLILLFTGCAKDFYTSYQPDTNEGGTLVIKLTDPMRNVNVTLNDKIVAEERHTDTITINNIPRGEYTLKLLGEENGRNDLDITDSVTLKDQQYKEKLYKTPSLTTGYYIQTGLIIAASTVTSILIMPNY